MKYEFKLAWGSPAGSQIVNQIKEMIQKGKLSPGERLPTVREAASELGVNFNTIARAYRQLRKMGWVVMRQGQGAFVADTIPIESPTQYKEKRIRELARDYLREAGMINVSPNMAVEILARIAFEQ